MPQEENHEGPGETPMSQRLTNDDFRRLLMTPRSAPSSVPAPGSIREATSRASSTIPPKTEDRAELRRKKKSYYAKLKKQEDDKMAELAEKYRDRARERRDGANPDYRTEDPPNASSAYRAVAPDLKSGIDAAERRRQMIQESKFLGGDMEHTHLVKGLDYALLQKVRSEITAKERERERQLEALAARIDDETVAATAPPINDTDAVAAEGIDEPDEASRFRTKLARDIHRTVRALRSRRVERNELFAAGRMAYAIDLDDDAESDVPTTLIRSKADVPALDSTPTLTTNDIVIEKLAQILTYLRQGDRHRGKRGRRGERTLVSGVDETNRGNLNEQRRADDSIYGDVGEYVPTRRRETDRLARDERHSYFDPPSSTSRGNVPPSTDPSTIVASASRSQRLLTRLAQEPEGYAECYPGLEEMHDAIDDSDDEVDYTKMDLGNKKGPVGRWDFDTQEEYSDYMNNKEALPKAAFQYGVKMADGRRTRKRKDKNEKAVLDREWQQIQNIIRKRGGQKSEDGPSEFKAPRRV